MAERRERSSNTSPCPEGSNRSELLIPQCRHPVCHNRADDIKNMNNGSSNCRTSGTRQRLQFSDLTIDDLSTRSVGNSSNAVVSQAGADQACERPRNKKRGNRRRRRKSPDTQRQPGNNQNTELLNSSDKTNRQLPHTVAEPFRRGERRREGCYYTDIPVSDMEIIKTIRCLLNKTTPDNLDIITLQATELPLRTAEDLCCIVDIIFEKAVAEPIYSSTYAALCQRVHKILNVITNSDPPSKKKFRVMFRQRYLAEFYDMVEVCRSSEPIHFSEKKRYKGLCRFIGELYNSGMISHCMIRECISELFLCEREEGIECLCTLLTTVGRKFDGSSGKTEMNRYMARLSHRATYSQSDTHRATYSLSDTDSNTVSTNNMSTEHNTNSQTTLSVRIRFMLLDLIQLRQAEWIPRIVTPKPKKIAELHADIEAERAAASRASACARLTLGTQSTRRFNSRANSRQ